MASIVGILLILLSLVGSGYALFAAAMVRRFGARPADPKVTAEPVSLLKPIHGAEPRLADNLAGFLDQDWNAPIEMIAGVQRADDPARVVISHLRDGGTAHAIREVMDPSAHGANAKISNLVNMMPATSHDLLILSDSDIVVPPDYLATIAAALARPGVGCVTCLYRGRGDAGFWSVLGAAAISWHFLPNVIVSLTIGAGDVCMGSTIALRRETLARIGGFERFRDTLADDHAIGAAVRELGLKVAVPRLIVTHASAERSLADLTRHELRWAATIRDLNLAGHTGSIVTHPLPLALLALPFLPGPAIGATLVAWAARTALAVRVDRLTGTRTASLGLIPLRDCLSFVLFVASFFVRSVDWRGARLKMKERGTITAEPESDTR